MGLVVLLNLDESNYFFRHVDNYFKARSNVEEGLLKYWTNDVILNGQLN